MVVAFAPNWPALAAAFLLAGALDNVIDVAQNAHGLRVQRHYGRSILNAFHGIWSIGAVSGGLLGSAAAGLGIPLATHLGLSAVVFGLAAIAAYRAMLPGRTTPTARSTRCRTRRPVQRRPGPPPRRGAALLGLGVLAACGAFVEDAGASWSALYLRSELGAGAAAPGWASSPCRAR